MTPNPSVSTPSSEERHGLEWLTRQLRVAFDYIEDADLRRDVRDWLRRVDQMPATTALDYIEAEIAQIPDQTAEGEDEDEDGETTHLAMHRTGKNGETDFPEACRGCEHFGTRCPVFSSPTEETRRKELRRDLEDAPASRVKQQYRTYARHNGCHRIRDIVSEWETQYDDLISNGWDFFEEVDERINVGRLLDTDELESIDVDGEEGEA